ncbi:MAG: hypothetical protein H0Z24_03195 [Thermosipho sp. (in: Bacteria)]|nr:hypothetical protein [Thermosipho sp. (in: thermotogales)]
MDKLDLLILSKEKLWNQLSAKDILTDNEKCKLITAELRLRHILRLEEEARNLKQSLWSSMDSPVADEWREIQKAAKLLEEAQEALSKASEKVLQYMRQI